MVVELPAELTERLCRHAERKGWSVQRVVSAAIDEYLSRAAEEEADDERVDQIAAEGYRRWKTLLDRLAE
ncbi:hypothetical protein AB0D67_03955 [Streptosporangium sp. NPDC048047]|uniref:hypothetical protein n=1 Tax=Streptosporangium sp. NPDC048047 TaxID=3155748 RepID=UPI0034125DB6